MSINPIDALGQVQIRWDTSSSAIQAARSAVLSIVDGGPPQSIPLDGPHLQAGAFTYKRHGTRVDARLTLVTAGGSSFEASTTFLGPPAVAEAEPVPAHVGAAALVEQNARLRRQLDEQIARNKTLQAQVDRLRKQRSPTEVLPARGLPGHLSNPAGRFDAPGVINGAKPAHCQPFTGRRLGCVGSSQSVNHGHK